nr:uncharacterized protein LOC113702922 [Coffea arabica]
MRICLLLELFPPPPPHGMPCCFCRTNLSACCLQEERDAFQKFKASLSEPIFQYQRNATLMDHRNLQRLKITRQKMMKTVERSQYYCSIYGFVIAGFATGFWGFLRILVLKKGWRHAFHFGSFLVSAKERIPLEIALKARRFFTFCILIMQNSVATLALDFAYEG